jgi:thiamine-phosphate diphosphorylase
MVEKRAIILQWQLYIITDRELGRNRSHQEIARQAIAAGAAVIQLRDKTASGQELFETARELRKLTRDTHTSLIINDRIDIALAVDADGVHVGQEDIPAAVARKLIGNRRILGVSAGTVQEAIEAEQQGADYLGAGPVFEARSTKVDAGEARGTDLVREIRKHSKIPVIAIGGIKPDNLTQVFQAGASGAAVISAIVTADNIENETRKFLEVIKSIREA